MQTKFIIYIIAILLIIIFIFYKSTNKEHAAFQLDGLYIPDNPLPNNEANAQRFIRIVGIEYHIKMDKYDRAERITYKPPKPEIGETKCVRTKCPAWYTGVVCWRCY